MQNAMFPWIPRSGITKRQRNILRAADHARDRKAWREATTQYRQFLSEVPADALIWTQLGHTLKESGYLPDAETAYRTGLAFAPQDAELYLQLGHVLKLQGRLLEAEKSYLRSSALDATLGAEAEIAWKDASTLQSPPVAIEHSPESESDTGSNDAPKAHATSVVVEHSALSRERERESKGVASAPNVDAFALEQAGHDARDRRAFAEAARYYRAFLDLIPDHGGIWIQYGHALRDQGDTRGSEDAYRSAIQVAPEDADAHFQLGHNLWLQSRLQEAFKSFRRSLTIDATRVSIKGMRAVGYRVEYEDIPLSKSSKVRIYLEISDLIATMREYNTISGIQRVQLGLIKYAASSDADCIVVFWEDGLLWAIELDALRDAVDIYDTPIEMAQRRERIEKMLGASKPVRPAPGDSFVITGAIWMRPDPTLDHQKVKNGGARLGAYIYDFIPLTNPEYCHPYLTDRFSNTIAELMLQLDFAFSISDFVASEFKRLRQQAGYPDIPIEAIKLAHAMGGGELDAEPSWSTEIAALRGKDFVLCVSSLAAHKNHIFALQVWRLLLEQGIEPPLLVLVGKVGYGVDDLTNQLKTSRSLGGRVMIVQNLNDAALATLYRSCLFTLFPSFVEGWGLPVGESLSYGKLCLASSTTAIPEVGGDLVTYIDPYNAREATALIAGLLRDRSKLLRLEARIKSEFRPRTWDDFGADFISAIQRSNERGTSALCLPSQWMLHPQVAPTRWRHGTALPQREAMAVATLARVALISSWFPAESWGCWMDGATSKISVPVADPVGILVRVVMQCRSVFWPRRNHLTVTASSGETATVLVAAGAQDFLVQLDCTVPPSRRIELALTLSGLLSTVDGEARILGIGLRKLFYAAVDMQSERIAAGVLMRPNSLIGAAGSVLAPYSLPAMAEAARRQAILGQGWLQPDAWGTWMDGQTAQLRLRPDAPPQTPIRIVLRLRSSAPHGGAVTLQATDSPKSTTVLPSGERLDVLASLTGQVGDDGIVSVALSVSPADARVGVSAVAWGDRDDERARLAVVEAVLFGPAESPDDDVALLSRELNFTVTGHLMGTYSLASVNRRLAVALDDAMPGQVRVVQVEGQPTEELTGLIGEDYTRLSVLAQREHSGNGPRVAISQHWPVWPPNLPYDLALAYVFWEESIVPRDMIQTLNTRFNGVLVPTRTVGKALIDSGLRVPVRRIGFAPDLKRFEALGRDRAVSAPATISHDRPFTFLHVSSCFPRKGVDVLLAAYAKAFSGRDPVRLIIKGFPNPHNDVAGQLASLRAADGNLAAIELIEMDLSEQALLDLYRQADAVVLPTRGEGFNIPAAEALAAGIPLIVTEFGGQADFTKGVARWVDYRFTHSRSHLRTSNSVWAEPDVADLADALQEAVRTPRSGVSGLDATAIQARKQAQQVSDTTQWADRIRSIASDLLAITAVLAPKIAWISSWKIRCGIGEYSRMLLDKFPAAARDVTVLCDTRTDDADLAGPGPLARKAWGRIDSGSIDGLAEAVWQTGAPVVVIQFHHALIGWGDLATLIEDDRVRMRHIVVTMHNTQELLEADPVVRQRLVAALHRVRRILVHTVSDLNILKEQGLVGNVTMFPHGALASTLEAQPTRALSPSQTIKIGSYGFFLPHKGFDLLIQALAIIRRKYGLATLTMVTAQYPTPESASEIARCQALARSLDIDSAITWHLDYLPNETSLKLLNDCDLLVLPYQHTPESSSAAVRSALAARVPVVVTPLLIFEELQNAVLRLHGTDVASIANGVEWAIQQQGTRKELVNAGTDWLDENSWTNVAERLSGLLKGLVVSAED